MVIVPSFSLVMSFFGLPEVSVSRAVVVFLPLPSFSSLSEFSPLIVAVKSGSVSVILLTGVKLKPALTATLLLFVTVILFASSAAGSHDPSSYECSSGFYLPSVYLKLIAPQLIST